MLADFLYLLAGTMTNGMDQTLSFPSRGIERDVRWPTNYFGEVQFSDGAPSTGEGDCRFGRTRFRFWSFLVCASALVSGVRRASRTNRPAAVIKWLFAGFLAVAAHFAPATAADGPPVTLSNLWSLMVRSHSDSVPALDAAGVIYFGTFDGKLWAVNPDGSRRWVFETRTVGKANIEIKSSPVLGSDGTVYFGCRDNRFYAVSPTGRLKWKFETEGWVDSSPAVGLDGSVYFGSWDKHLYAVDSGGRLKWRFATGDVVTSSPAITRSGLIVFGSHDRKVYGLRESGEKAWEYQALAQIISSPAIDTNDVIYITSLDGFFHALDPDGAMRWKIKTGGATESSPVIAQGGYVVIGVNKNLWAISREGMKLWEHPATYDNYQQPIYSTPLALADNSVIAVSGYGLLAGYNESPRMVWKHYLYGFGSGGPAVATNGTIYISSVIPNVSRAFAALSSTVPVATSPWPRFRGPLGNGRAD